MTLPPIDLDQLSESDVDRLRELTERAAPSRQRPRLSTQVEDALNGIERRTAGYYTAMEDISYRFRRLARRIATEDGESRPSGS